jgi:hypothetical protein
MYNDEPMYGGLIDKYFLAKVFIFAVAVVTFCYIIGR